MKWISSFVFLIITLFTIQDLVAQDSDFLMDERDGNIYLVKKFHDQWWMCQNLKYDIGEGSSCYEEDENNCMLKGRWYVFDAAQKACPEGYRLPGDDDWKALERFLGMTDADFDKQYSRNSGTVGKQLKAGGTGFDADFTGMVHPMGRDSYMGTHAYFWTSTEVDQTNAWSRVIIDKNDGVDRQVVARNFGLSIRCVKDAEQETENN